MLRRQGIRPRKRLGQNFLLSEKAIAASVDAAELQSSDRVLEIGPGTGVLTAPLVERARCVLAVEIDADLVNLLRSQFSHRSNLTVLEADILKLDYVDALRRACPEGSGYKVVANLPYYITSRVLRLLLETVPRPELIVVMVQKEVGLRAVAAPPDMSMLAISAQYYSEPEIVATVPAGAFYPRPDVDSVIMRMRTRTEPPFPDVSTNELFRVASAGFGQKRKTLLNSISSNLGMDKSRTMSWLVAAGIPENARAEQLSLEDWARLCRCKPAE